MHRIDGPGATVDNRFTDGDPVGGVQATIVTDDWANDVQEELMSVLTAAGIGPVKGTQDQVLQAITSLISIGNAKVGGVVGDTRNALMSIPAASATGTFTADEIIVAIGIGGRTYRLGGFSKTINLGVSGAGGMDAGTAPVNGFVALYAIYNPATLTSALLAVNATSVVAPEVYGGANMPSGYTASALVSVLATNASGQLRAGQFQIGRKVILDPVSVLSSVLNTLTYTSLSIAGAAPINAKFASFTMQSGSTAAGLAVFQIASNSNGVGARQVSGQSVSQIGAPATNVALLTPQTVFRINSVNAGTTSFQSFVTDYKF